MRLLLMRHGQTHANVAGELDTAHPGKELTDLGHTQATTAAQAITDEHVDAIYVSSRLRTHQTAAPLARARALNPIELPGLEEVDAGELEMLADHDSVHAYIGTIATWLGGDWEARMPGSETGREFLARYDAAVARIHQAGHDAALVVSHGAAIRSWTFAKLGDEPRMPAPTTGLHNTGLVIVEGDPDRGWSLVSWHGEPVGGAFLDDESAPDPTADLDEA